MADDDTEEMKREDEVVVREGVSSPTWLAGALIVVLALMIGGVGYAIGNSDSNNDFLDPIANIDGGAPGGIGREGPGEMRRGPGGPGFQHRGPGGDGPGEHRRGECRDGEERKDGNQEGDPEEGDGDGEGEESNDVDPFVPGGDGAAF